MGRQILEVLGWGSLCVVMLFGSVRDVGAQAVTVQVFGVVTMERSYSRFFRREGFAGNSDDRRGPAFRSGWIARSRRLPRGWICLTPADPG